MVTMDLKTLFFEEFIAHPKWYLRERYKFHGLRYYDTYFQKIHYIFGQLKGRMIRADNVLNYVLLGEDVRDKTIDIFEVTDEVLAVAETALDESDKVFVASYYRHVEAMQHILRDYHEIISDVVFPGEVLHVGDIEIK